MLDDGWWDRLQNSRALDIVLLAQVPEFGVTVWSCVEYYRGRDWLGKCPIWDWKMARDKEVAWLIDESPRKGREVVGGRWLHWWASTMGEVSKGDRKFGGDRVYAAKV